MNASTENVWAEHGIACTYQFTTEINATRQRWNMRGNGLLFNRELKLILGSKEVSKAWIKDLIFVFLAEQNPKYDMLKGQDLNSLESAFQGHEQGENKKMTEWRLRYWMFSLWQHFKWEKWEAIKARKIIRAAGYGHTMARRIAMRNNKVTEWIYRIFHKEKLGISRLKRLHIIYPVNIYKNKKII